MKVHDQIIEENKEGNFQEFALDSNITMNKHIKNISKQAGIKLNTLERIAKFLDGSKRKLLMNIFVLSQFNLPYNMDVLSTTI